MRRSRKTAIGSYRRSWRSELLSVLRFELHLSPNAISESDAFSVFRSAEWFFGSREHRPDPARVLALCSRALKSYDAEFLALAEQLDTYVLSNDLEFLSLAGPRGRRP